jgi:uncharacterized protein YgbK (DUF1537 family)
VTGIQLGVVADDLTGACDLASAVTRAGLSTTVLLGQPDPSASVDTACAVIALKSRTAPIGQAVSDTAHAGQWLLDQGAARLYQKYCSTFDSTPTGNIGPAADALAHLGSPAGSRALTVGTPATPAVGRTQYQGHLFVGDRLLSESSMRDHPLTPMRDSDLVRVLGRQTSGRVALLPHEVVRSGADAVRAALLHHLTDGASHVLVDAISDSDLDVTARALLEPIGDARIVAGGAAGLGAAIARALRSGSEAAGPSAARASSPTQGRRLVLSGSASERTREQVAAFRGPVVRIDAARLVERQEPEAAVAELVAAVAEAFDGAGVDQPVLVTATADADEVRAVQGIRGSAAAAALIEHVLAEVAARCVEEHEVTHLIVAGGETSGAVASALGVAALRVQRDAAPGVPWMTTDATPAREALALLLKSGNFGGVDLFTSAWEVAP